MSNMKQQLNNIFGNRPTTTIYATVVDRISPIRVLVEDRAGRRIPADHDADAKISKGSKVRIRDGRIIATGSQAGKHRIYEV